ncbi:hypothetical protein [Thalassolituus oleivorans]|jgi:hypothetical protein|uniref:hypothetical protein n=1 Tax=Thalassolituus oleivorans TaxID=187493 RepID=UPI00042DBFF6|nr:hypothetical protein [Thalassolituus oleivorans]AHK17950.1 hypothetical protein R615_17460 [Thalassolituus oleivorans R6-15]
MEVKQTESVLENTMAFDHGVTLPSKLTLVSVIRYRAAVAIEWIKEDIRRGIQAETIITFSELHNAVDANMYLIDESHRLPKAGSFYEWSELNVQGVCDQFNRVMDLVNDWLATRNFIDHYQTQ